jgi:hypothetical protein
MWVRGAPTFGVLRILPLFRRVLLVATGATPTSRLSMFIYAMQSALLRERNRAVRLMREADPRTPDPGAPPLDVARRA